MKTLDEKIGVSAQLYPNTLTDLQAAGFEQIICNRPDNETPQQPRFAAIREAATALGITTIYAPVAKGTLDETAIDATRTTLASGRKTIIYCASGSRSTIVWAIIAADSGRDIEEILERVANAGYDPGKVRDILLQRARDGA